ncbi:MAG: di-trans,poly-cis-decaprenylcistransferase [Deltaproteobacteria bacterium]|nr:di-trans,poly-cis-decaprenylcistransferase [Deltaproteobacteria bacterium]MBI3076467.1 di-trans,poly-cis-decaprenylcistransferase [Deltaproteobacteria bacterium]
MPRHIGLILDGNRRYASGLGREPSFGHELGADKLQEVLGWCADLDIRMATVWVLSTENLSRPEGELRGLLEVIERKILQMVQDPRVHRRRVRIRAVGQLDLLPESTRQVIARAEEATQAYDAFALNIAVGYGGRQEIVDAVKSLLRAEANQGASLEEIIGGLAPDEISKYLYTQGLPDPDLIIRTSGEVRLSGFLLWQSAYSEFYFCDAFWPAFRKIDFLRAIRSFQQRERRYGR